MAGVRGKYKKKDKDSAPVGAVQKREVVAKLAVLTADAAGLLLLKDLKKDFPWLTQDCLGEGGLMDGFLTQCGDYVAPVPQSDTFAEFEDEMWTKKVDHPDQEKKKGLSIVTMVRFHAMWEARGYYSTNIIIKQFEERQRATGKWKRIPKHPAAWETISDDAALSAIARRSHAGEYRNGSTKKKERDPEEEPKPSTAFSVYVEHQLEKEGKVETKMERQRIARLWSAASEMERAECLAKAKLANAAAEDERPSKKRRTEEKTAAAPAAAKWVPTNDGGWVLPNGQRCVPPVVPGEPYLVVNPELIRSNGQIGCQCWFPPYPGHCCWRCGRYE